MPYSFDTIVTRRHTNSFKWDTPTNDDTLPLWVADMDFTVAPCIIEALRRRVDHGVFGYTKVPSAYYDAIVRWFSTRHGWTIDPSHIIYTSGVVPALSAIIKALTKPDDRVIVQTPAYNCFFSSVRNNACQLSEDPLLYADGRYTIDFDNLATLAADPSSHLMLLCNPHNPVGRVWTRNELTRIATICRDNDVTVIADEIHCELTYADHTYTPFALVAEKVGVPYVVTCSPSKAFNIAGLQIANIVAPDPTIRQLIDRAINDNEVCDVNPFGVDALIAAYNDGADWLDQLRHYIYQNYLFARTFLHEHLPQLHVLPLEGTYLMWIDFSATGLNSHKLATLLERQAHVMLSPGHIYGPGGEHFMRLNLACPRAILSEALTRIVGLKF